MAKNTRSSMEVRQEYQVIAMQLGDVVHRHAQAPAVMEKFRKRLAELDEEGELALIEEQRQQQAIAAAKAAQEEMEKEVAKRAAEKASTPAESKPNASN